MNDSIPEDKRGKGLGHGQITDIDEAGNAIVVVEDEVVEMDGEKIMYALQSLVGFALGVRHMCAQQGSDEGVERINAMFERCEITIIETDEPGQGPSWEFQE